MSLFEIFMQSGPVFAICMLTLWLRERLLRLESELKNVRAELHLRQIETAAEVAPVQIDTPERRASDAAPLPSAIARKVSRGA